MTQIKARRPELADVAADNRGRWRKWTTANAGGFTRVDRRQRNPAFALVFALRFYAKLALELMGIGKVEARGAPLVPHRAANERQADRRLDAPGPGPGFGPGHRGVPT